MEDTQGVRKLPKSHASPVKVAPFSVKKEKEEDETSTHSQPAQREEREEEVENIDADSFHGSQLQDDNDNDWRDDAFSKPFVSKIFEKLNEANKNKTEEEKALEKYSMNLLDQGMKNRRIYVIRNLIDSTLELESQVDALKRTLLSDAVRKSLKNYPHLIREVGADDVAAMWLAVAKTEQPEPYELLVSGIDRLTLLKKTESIVYQTWIMELSEIILQLQAVDFHFSDMMRIGYTLHLLGNDKRYLTIISEAKQKKWTYDMCLTKFSRTAVDIGDTARSNKAPAKPDPSSHEQNYQAGGRGRGGKGGKGGKGRHGNEKAKGETPEAEWKRKESSYQNDLKIAHRKIQCSTETERGSCANASCNYMHKSEDNKKEEQGEVKFTPAEQKDIKAPS